MKILNGCGFSLRGLKIPVFAFSLVLSVSPASGESIDDVALRILDRAPSLRSLSLENEAQRISSLTETNLPDPELEGEYLAAPAGESDRWSLSLGWSIDWPGVYAARRKEAKELEIINRTSEKVARNKTMIEIRRLLLDYILAVRTSALYDEMSAANDSVAMLAEKGLRGGEMTRLDLSKLRLERLSLEASRVEAQDNMQASIVALSAIYGADCSPLLVSLDCDFPAVEAPDETTFNGMSADEREAAAALGLARLSESTAARESLPGISLALRHAFEDGAHFNGGSLGLSIPLFSNKDRRKAAKAAVKASEYRLECANADRLTGIEVSLKRLCKLKNQVEAISVLLADTDESDLLMKAYKGKVITLIEYLNERNYFLEARLTHLALLHALANARLDLDDYLSL